MITKKSKDSSAAEFFKKLRGDSLSFGRALAAIRQVEDLTQVTFAKKLGISTAHLCDLEKGRRFVSAERAAHLAKRMGHPAEYWVKLAIQDQIDQAGLKLKVAVSAA
jgi:transcriptional regulator with XRE-family HTH domain